MMMVELMFLVLASLRWISKKKLGKMEALKISKSFRRLFSIVSFLKLCNSVKIADFFKGVKYLLCALEF